MSSSKGEWHGRGFLSSSKGSGMGGASSLQVRGVAWEGLHVFK